MGVAHQLIVLGFFSAVLATRGLECYRCHGDWCHSLDIPNYLPTQTCQGTDVCETKRLVFPKPDGTTYEAYYRGCKPFVEGVTGCLTPEEYTRKYLDVLYPGFHSHSTAAEGKICFCKTDLCNNEDMNLL